MSLVYLTKQCPQENYTRLFVVRLLTGTFYYYSTPSIRLILLFFDWILVYLTNRR